MELGATDVIDLGCATGVLAVELAAGGCQVVGTEPADAMLGIARARPGSDGVTWIEVDAATYSPDATQIDRGERLG
jgi:2-polyprenyl-3-methyl-5-hydroxy-6-metoxy-1,4-benzoquinol methylase